MLLDALFLSYKIWPAADMRPHFSLTTLVVLLHEHNGLFNLALLLAAPVVVTLLLFDFAAGIIGKSAPNLHVQEFTLPVKIWLAWFVLLLSLPYVHEKMISLLPTLVKISRNVLFL
jgi:type III secretory pathway component EscT